MSHETIYRSLYVQTRGVLKKELQDCLRSRRTIRRSRHATQKGLKLRKIKDAILISARPPEIEDRAVPEHWEGDLIVGANNGYIATLVERHSRFVMLAKVPKKDTQSVITTLIKTGAQAAKGALSLTDLGSRLRDDGPRPEIKVEARYLFGAPGAGLAMEGDVTLSPASNLPDYPGYRFGAHDAAFSTIRDVLQTPAETDAGGNAVLTLVLPDPGEGADRPMNANIALRLREGSGRPIERVASRLVLPSRPVIGIKPHFEADVVPQGDDAGFDLIAVGPDGERVTQKVQWTLNRIETSYQWYSLYGEWNWEVTTRRSRVAEGEMTLSADGTTPIAAPVDWGNYELVVETLDSAHSTSSVDFDAGWYAPASAADTPDTLKLSLDKDAYRPGDTARLRLEPRGDGVALVTVMSNRLIDMKAVPVSAGETIVDLPVTDDWGAGAYVTASVIRPTDQDAGRAPVRALGLSYAPVDPGARRLSVEFEVAAEASPRTRLPVALKVDNASEGEDIFATIAAVDVGILNLTAFEVPDPEGHYFGQRKLGVAIRDIYGRLIDGQTGALGAIRSGGDAGQAATLQAPPPTEELVAYFSGPLTIGADGYARTEFDLPAFNGTIRLMAIAWSKSAVGQARADVLARDPVVVTASLPRFIAPGDESRLLLEIVHATGPAGEMALALAGDGVTLGANPETIDLAEGGKAAISVPITAPMEEGIHSLRVALTTPDGTELTKTLALPVQANDPAIVRQSRFELADGATFTLDGNAFAGLVPGSGRATIAAGPIARFDAPGLLNMLDTYPYGCTEQLTSKTMPLLYFDEVARLMGSPEDDTIRERIDQSIARILLNQSANGAFGLWHADTGDLWLDAYVTDFLSRARAQGYDVPELAFRNAMDNLRNQINYAPDFDEEGGPFAYALMVLAREGAAAVGDLRYYADVKSEAFDTPIAAAQLGAALASYGDQRRADGMFAQAAMLISDTPEAGQIWRADYGTHLRDAAAVLTLAAEAGSNAVSSNALGNRVAAGLAGQRLSTQEATWALLATHALIDRPGTAGFSVNGAAVEGPMVRFLDSDTGVPQPIVNGSGKSQILTLSTFGIPTEPEPAGGKGYTITRSHYTLEGEMVDVAVVPQGTRIVTVIEVVPHGQSDARLMVDSPLPAGFEIDNPNLLRAGDVAALDWLDTVGDTRMAEFRQDRFLAAIDWRSDAPFRLAYIVRAISPGNFHLPAASVEDMYRPDYRARTDAGRVTVVE